MRFYDLQYPGKRIELPACVCTDLQWLFVGYLKCFDIQNAIAFSDSMVASSSALCH